MLSFGHFNVRKIFLMPFVLLLTQCVGQDDMSVVDIQVNDMHVGASETTVYLDFSVPGCFWEIACPEFDWISVGRYAGSDTAHIPIIISENTGLLPRQCSMTIKVSKGNSSRSKDVLLIQDGQESHSDELKIRLSGESVSVDGKYYARLRWDKIDDAQSYNVYYSRYSTRDFRQYGSPVSATTLLADTHNGANYYYITYRSSVAESAPSEIIRIYVEKNSSLGNWDNSGDQGGGEPDDDKPDNPPAGDDDKVPSAPTDVSCTVSGNSIRLSWTVDSDVSDYRIYKSASSGGSYSLLATVKSSPYYDNDPIEGYNYYKVSAVNSAGEGAKSVAVSCKYEAPAPEASKPSAPTGLSAENIGNDVYPVVNLSWNTVEKATSYKVYRSSSSSSGYSLLGTATVTKYNDNNPMNGKNYYKVSAVNSAGESAFSSYVYFNYDAANLLKPAPPQITLSTSSTSVTLSWTCQTGNGYGTPKEYKVHRQNPYTNEYELLTTTTSRSYTDRNVHPGRNLYVVEAINAAGSSLNYAQSDVIPLSRPSGFSATVSGSYITCKWSKVTQATGYQIYYSNSAGGQYYIMEDISDGSATSKTIYYPASSGTMLYLKIRAYWMIGNSSPVYSDYSSYKKVTF